MALYSTSLVISPHISIVVFLLCHTLSLLSFCFVFLLRLIHIFHIHHVNEFKFLFVVETYVCGTVVLMRQVPKLWGAPLGLGCAVGPLGAVILL